MNFIDFTKIWKRHRQETALITGEEQITYAELHQKVRNKSIALQQAGITPVDRVALWGGTDVSYIENILALLHLDVVSVPLSIRFTKRQLNECLRHSACTKIIRQHTATEFKISPGIPEFDMDMSDNLIWVKNRNVSHILQSISHMI